MALEELRQLGLTEYEVRVYETLLSLGKGTGGEIARKSKVPHGKTYQSLHMLEEKGLITILPLKPKIFSAIEPKKGIESLVMKRVEDIENLGELMVKLTKEVKLPEKEEIKDKFFVIENRQKLFQLGNEQFTSAKKEFLLISRGEPVPLSIQRTMAKMVERGVDFRFIIFQFDESNKDCVMKNYARYKLRYYPTGPFTLMIVDKKIVDISIRDPKNTSDQVGVCFHNAAIANAMRDYFLMIWDKAKPIKF